MKKVLALVLAVLMIVSMCACSSAKKEDTVETIKIGLAFPMSGTAAMAGKYSTHGADVLKEELGGKITVGDKEYPVEFVTMDTEGSEEKTTNVYQKLIEEEKVIAIVGPDSSKCMLAAAPIAQNAKCPAITTFGTNTAVTEVGNYIFRACFIDPFQGSVAAAYCDQQGYKTACIMFNVAGPAIEGVAYVSAFSAESTDEAAKNFVDDYVKLYPDELPNSNAELTYETAKMVVWAIQNAKTLDRDGVRDALDTIDGLELPSGKMTMDPTTRNPIKGGVIMQYDAEGVTHYVSTVNP